MDIPSWKIVLGVTGSIAASKAVELARLLKEAGHDVYVIQTPASRHFVADDDFREASGNDVATEQFGFQAGEEPDLTHIELSTSDLMVIAPATANTIGKLASGIADNLLLSTFLALDCPVMVCPAMNSRMWEHPAVQVNISLLTERGAHILPPATGSLACGEEGVGRLPEPQDIFTAVQQFIQSRNRNDMAGIKVLVSAGGTREPIDAVRFIANRSSGRMGYSMAEAAASRGAEVTVVSANCRLPRSHSIRYIDVSTSTELFETLKKESKHNEILVMAAAVSDYRVSAVEPMGKMERDEEISLNLVKTIDIVSALEGGKNGLMKIGFSAEFGAENIDRAKRKMLEKELDIMVFNDISRNDIGFDSEFNEVTIIRQGLSEISIGKSTKLDCANRILDQVAEVYRGQHAGR